MQLPFSWLKSLFPHDVNSKIIDDALTRAGIEVDLVETFDPPFSNVVVAKVESVSAHPDANKLQVATVFDGTERFQVVCGAKNCREGLIVAFAKIGAVLGRDNPFEIKERAVRGVNSHGMLCSADELGLTTEEAEGIIELDDSFPLGCDFHSLLKDEIFHISITPNLGHVLSVAGIARELSAFLKLPYKHEKKQASLDTSAKLNIKIQSQDSPSYAAAKLSGVLNKHTPFLIQHRLRLAGFNPKNLVVDILNYVMFETGQPMHGFDAKKLHSESLVIHNLEHLSQFSALNGKTYEVSPKTLVISSGDHIAAVAGVMGSDATACTNETSEVILESAYFTSRAARSSIKSLDLRTDAANRFEKGIDPNGMMPALGYAAALINHYGSSHLSASFSHITPYHVKPVTLRVEKANKLLGTNLSQNEMKELLERLEMAVKLSGSDKLIVEAPSYRHDIKIEEDLIEEIGRLYGLDHLKGHLSYQATTLLDNPLYTFEKPLKKALFAEGLQEILTCDLLSRELVNDFKLEKSTKVEAISVLHPRSTDQCTLRMSLLASFIPCVKKNFSNKETDLALFEVGKIHAKKDGQFIESLQAGILITGLASTYYFDPKPRECDFFDLKGIVENFLSDMGIEHVEYKISHDKVFHPYQQLTVYKNGEFIGQLGQIHPKILRAYDIEQKLFYAEFSVPELMKNQKSIYPAKLPPTQPYIERDWTVTLKEEQSFDELLHAMNHEKSDLSESITLLDIYPQGDTKNVTLRIRYRHKEKSLESTFIDQIHQKFISDVAKKLALSL